MGPSPWTLILAAALAGASLAAASAAAPPARPPGPTPSQGPNSLSGRTAGSFPLARATPAEVKQWLGEPAVANEEGKGALWTYRLQDCALMVFFKDEGTGLRVSGVATGPRRRGQPAPDAESCIAGARP